jgi:Protein of unknown function (DUF3035)
MRKAGLGACLCIVAGLMVSGCSSQEVKRTFGLERQPPDEFKIVARAPLSTPPDFMLRPPKPGSDRPQEQAVAVQARQTVFGPAADARAQQARQAADLATGRSGGETALLDRAGARNIDPSIRKIVNDESATLASADSTFIDRLLFWRAPEQPGTIVDPRKETQRLRENVAQGRPVTEGETPIVRRKKRGIFEGIF